MIVPYYQGRPARLWTTGTSGYARVTAAKPAASPTPASLRPATRARTGEETSSLPATAAIISAWETWASNWFSPDR
jgi:hypothetical protein